MSAAREIQRRLPDARRVLASLSHVTSVSLGWKETGGLVTGIPAWRVYVRHKLPAALLQPQDVVPHELFGIATDIVAALRGVPVATTSLPPTPVCPGVTISNLRGPLDDQTIGRNTSGMGTLGFLALVNETRDRIPVLVSNRHVLLANDATASAPIYRLMFLNNGGQSYRVRRDTLESIAEVLDQGMEGNYRFQYPDDAPGDYFVDCASARILPDLTTVSAFLRVIDGVPSRVAIRRVTRTHPLDAVGWRAPRVRKFGGASGLTTGRVVDAAAPVDVAGGPQRLNNLVIRSDSGPFVEPGDSGALVLNERTEAVGLVWGRSDTDPRVAYACHIHPVLDRLRVTMMAGGLA